MLKNILISAGVALIVASVVAVMVGGNDQSGQPPIDLGRTGTAFPNGICVGTACTATVNTLSIGASGTGVTQILTGTCSPLAVGTHAASSTASYVCKGITGIATTDKVFVSLSRSPAPSAAKQTNGFIITSALATTTTAIDMRVYNATGAATSTVDAFRSMNFWVVR